MIRPNERFNGSLLTASGRTLYYRTANDGNPTVKVYDENEEFIIDICVKTDKTPEKVVNEILEAVKEGMID